MVGTVISSIIFIHAFLGGLALPFGFGVILLKKGGRIHKLGGILFYYSLLFSSVMATVVALLPQHTNLFLCSIGLSTIYLLITGKRASLYTKDRINLNWDKGIALLMIIVSALMIFGPMIVNGTLNIVASAIGLVSGTLAIRDLLLIRYPDRLKEKWLKLHIGKMVGAFISAVTAFTVNQFVQNLWGWFLPGLIGGMYITYWMIRLNRSKGFSPGDISNQASQ